MNSLRYKLALTNIVILCSLTAYTQSFSNPESVTFDVNTNTRFVSNTKTGSILKVDANGITSSFVTGYSSFMGLKIHKGVLYAAENTENGDDFVRGFSIITGKQVFSLAIPNTMQLNDVEIDNAGNLYVSDRGANKIYKVKLSTKTYAIINSTIPTPNGLYFNQKDNSLLVCNTIKNSNIYTIDLHTNKIEVLVHSKYSNFDGITCDGKGGIYITSWSLDWKKSILLKYDGNKFEELLVNNFGMADIEYNRRDNVIEIAKYWDNSVLRHPLN